MVLAHGHSLETGQDDWNPFADHLAGLGYGVLTFDFRGFCDLTGCSEAPRQLGQNWRDAAAAVEYLRARGSARIFLVGASMGGIAAFRAADEAELELAGIVSLATPQFGSVYYAHLGEPAANDVTPERLQRIAAPKLFIAGKDDSQGPFELAPGNQAVLFAEEARSMFDASSEPEAARDRRFRVPQLRARGRRRSRGRRSHSRADRRLHRGTRLTMAVALVVRSSADERPAHLRAASAR